MKFAEIMRLAFFSRDNRQEGIKEFTQALETAVNTFNTSKIREEAREYGKEKPEAMKIICLAWTACMDYMGHERLYDDRNRIAVERCHDFISLYNPVEEGKDPRYQLLFQGFKNHTMPYMHRTNIQTATQVLWEGMLAAIEGTELEEVAVKASNGDVTQFTRMPMI